MTFIPEPDSNYADVSNLTIIDVCVDDKSLVLSFVSGEGTVIDYRGEEKNPLCFTIQIYPLKDAHRSMLFAFFKQWSDDADPIDLHIEDGNACVCNTSINCSIEVQID